MAITVNDNEMTSNVTTETARRLEAGGWVVSGRTGIFDRNQAITALTIAEIKAAHLATNPRYRKLLEDFEAELTKPPNL